MKTMEDPTRDQLKITISFGLMSFYFGLLVFLNQVGEIKGVFLITLSIITEGIFVIALIEFFIFIVLTASFYKNQQKGILDIYKINPRKKEIFFDEAVEWSFVGITVGVIQLFFQILLNYVCPPDFCQDNKVLCIIGALLIGVVIIKYFRKIFE